MPCAQLDWGYSLGSLCLRTRGSICTYLVCPPLVLPHQRLQRLNGPIDVDKDLSNKESPERSPELRNEGECAVDIGCPKSAVSSSSCICLQQRMQQLIDDMLSHSPISLSRHTWTPSASMFSIAIVLSPTLRCKAAPYMPTVSSSLSTCKLSLCSPFSCADTARWALAAAISSVSRSFSWA